jgi:hypothetical protein
MNVRLIPVALTAAALSTVLACGTSNPTRPSTSFTAPISNGPANGTNFNFNQQPITLTIVNAVHTGPAPTYNVDVASNADFSNVVFSQQGIPEGAGGTTTVTVSSLAGNTTYYWRWRAVLDGVEGEPSGTQSFFVKPNIVLNAPVLVDPAASASVFNARPTFRITNSTFTGEPGTISYEFQVSSSSSFASIIASQTVQQQGGAGATTSWTPSTDLPEGNLFWRARARDLGNGVDGSFSSAAGFERKFGIDLTKVVYQMGPNISGWAETSKITSASHSNGQLCIEHTRLGVWPSTDFFGDPSVRLEGNQWIFANINGTWYGGAADWYRPGQGCKEVDENIGHDSFTQNPIASWRPRPGEVFGVMSSTPARFWPDMKTLDQRTDVALIVW